MIPAAVQSLLRRIVPARLPVLLVGAPGVGKTALVRDVARELDYGLVVSHPVTGDPTDYRGLPWIVDGCAAFLPVGDLSRLAELEGRPGIWLIDDLGQSLAATQAAIMQLVHADGRALNGFRLPSTVSVVACSNRTQDRAGVGTFLSPLLSRFTTVLTVEPEAQSFVAWGLRHGHLDPLVASFLLWMPKYLIDTAPASHCLEPRCSPRTWDHVSQLLRIGLPDTELSAAVQGAITPGVAIEFLAYLEVYRSLPDVALLRADPAYAPLPMELNATLNLPRFDGQ